MYLIESPKVNIIDLKIFDVVYVFHRYNNGIQVPHYCIILKILPNSNLIVQCLTSSNKWQKNKIHIIEDPITLNLPDKNKTTKILLDNNVNTLNNYRSYAIKTIRINDIKRSKIWHLGQRDIDFLKNFYANKNIKLEKEFIYITEDELLKFGLKLKKEYEKVNISNLPEYLYHKGNPYFRKEILNKGLIPKIGESYKLYYEDRGIKPIPGIFMYDKNIQEYDSTYDDDIWEINIKDLNLNNLFYDPYLKDKGCYFYTDIIYNPKLIYKGTEE